MLTDTLVILGSRASAGMILTPQSRNILPPASDELIINKLYNTSHWNGMKLPIFSDNICALQLIDSNSIEVRPLDAIGNMQRWFRKMTWRLFGTKPLSSPTMKKDRWHFKCCEIAAFWISIYYINTISPRNAFMHHWSRSALVQTVFGMSST